MNKPTGYDEAQEMREFTPVELGGHYAVIKQVSERESSTGKDMVVVLFDFCQPDKQPDYFKDLFDSDNSEDKKWAFNGSKYIMVADYNDPNKTSRNFKTFCTCVERSNNFTIKWGSKNWGQQFVGKKIGVVFGEEEHEYDGKTSMRRLPKWFCTWDKVEGSKIPAPKYLPNSTPASTAPNDDFINVPESEAEEIPF